MSNLKDEQWSDQRLVTAVLNGHRHAFGLIIKKTEGLVAQMTFKMINSPGDRKDIAQDVYLKAFKNLRGFKFQSKLSTWIGQIAYNTCLHYLEKKKLVLIDNFGEDGEIPENNFNKDVRNDTEEKLFSKELANMLHTEIEQLKPLYKTLISLYHQEDLSYAEIAEITSLPEGTVKNYIFRARKMLKENILLKHKRNEL
ncbi:RNA polymerase sigma factor [Mucilaginibacter lappiensis]|uniref:RNA polymerase sigma-70 factor (ECF subfamily) n=1 Tax=Mucilaginibacter lappiensis TaxID=354630 RepID=A0A1N7EYT9_9SPHI|nr:sigma-70 family RNA polymerase sigma factor [Mucilaginibacter lappiensis]MBB6112174.1 RNA polymerase sigma-70 factor (ECF subfamily) [Mucilaginibacter lappiensis]MBB6130716.1 RNA polymerase sigma-70 factor (ECF subfamily) [Mucilaginibacter lappiensis]SIR93234.1 RNA polymerase sigma-70 factor, ECF subfamily [Mucilaginibacter lappiensis]